MEVEGEMASANLSGAVQDSTVLNKTRMCKFYRNGKCIRGEECSFAHSAEQLQPRPNLFRTELCFPFAQTGSCWVGSACKFAHSTGELRPIGPFQARAVSRAATKRRAAEATARRARNGALQLQKEATDQRPSAEVGNAADLLQRLEVLQSEGVKPRAARARQARRMGSPSPSASGLSTEEGDASRRQSWRDLVALVAAAPERQEGESSSAGTGPHGWESEGEGSAPAEGISEEGLRLGARAGLVLSVRNTFISAQPAELRAAAARRRASSVPAARQTAAGAAQGA